MNKVDIIFGKSKKKKKCIIQNNRFVSGGDIDIIHRIYSPSIFAKQILVNQSFAMAIVTHTISNIWTWMGCNSFFFFIANIIFLCYFHPMNFTQPLFVCMCVVCVCACCPSGNTVLEPLLFRFWQMNQEKKNYQRCRNEKNGFEWFVWARIDRLICYFSSHNHLIRTMSWNGMNRI